jgi:hypothetical protein
MADLDNQVRADGVNLKNRAVRPRTPRALLVPTPPVPRNPPTSNVQAACVQGDILDRADVLLVFVVDIQADHVRAKFVMPR